MEPMFVQASDQARPFELPTSYHGERAPRFVHPDSDGLQISPDTQEGRLKETNRDFEGLQSIHAANPDTGKIHYVNTVHVIAHNEEEQRAPSPLGRKRRWWWVLGVAALIVVILAAILGGVLGSKARQNAASASGQSLPGAGSGSSGGSQPPNNVNARILSTVGTWNGTGITISPLATKDHSMGFTTCACWFQDYHGKIQLLQFDFNDLNGTINFLGPSQADYRDFLAANGTSLASHLYNVDPKNSLEVQLIYVAPNGTLADLFHTNPPNGPIRAGNLSAQGFKAPTDNRPTMSIIDDGASTEGINLFAGGADNKLHAYAYDHSSAVWYPGATFTFPNSWAYGGATAINNYNGTFVRTLYFTDSKGAIHSAVESNISADDSMGLPAGSNWDNFTVSSQSSMANTSIIVGIPEGYSENLFQASYQEHLLFSKPDGHLGAQVVRVENDQIDYITGFGAYDSGFESHSIMQGSDMQNMVLKTTLVFYQENGNGLSWIALNNDSTKAQTAGQFLVNGTDSTGNQTWSLSTSTP